MCHERRLKSVRKLNVWLFFAFLLLLVGCRDVNPNATTPSDNPLDFEPVPELGIQTQSSSLTAWQPMIDYLPGRIDFDAVDVDVYGTGLGSRFAATSQATVDIPNPETVRRLYVQVVVKAGTLSNPVNEFIAPDDIVVSTPVESKRLTAGELHLAPLTDDAGIVVNNTGRVYETELQPASHVSVDISNLRKFGTLYTPRALIVYAQREITDYANGTMSAGKVVNRYLHGYNGFEQATVSLDITGWSWWNGAASSDLEVTFALAELGSDPRHVTLIAEAGGVRREVTLDRPTNGDEFSHYTLILPEVSGDTDAVTATVISPKAQPGESVWDNGDSVFWQAVTVKMPYERPCWVGSYSNRLTTQASVDMVVFCTVIDGDLYIGPEDPADPITNLQGLRNVRSAARLTVRGTSLTNLEGVENLELYGYYKNDALVISDNPLLQNLQGLKGQEEIFGFVEIIDNASLETLEGLEGTKEITFGLRIRGNPSLRTLKGLEDLVWAGRLTIAENASLEHITDLINFRGWNPPDDGGRVSVDDNPKLDCSLEPQPSILPVGRSSGNLVDCPVIAP